MKVRQVHRTIVNCLVLLAGLVATLAGGCGAKTEVTVVPSVASETGENKPAENQAGPIRVATFNVSLNRPQAGALVMDLNSGMSEQAGRLAEIIQRVRPDVILLNEFDADPDNRGLVLFQEKYLAAGQNGQLPIEYPWTFVAPVNTGVDSGLDLNGDGETGTADDAFGYGEFPGQYSMAVLSRFPIDSENVRTFQKFLWSELPDVTRPVLPESGESYYASDIWAKLRLASKSMWDVPIRIGDHTIHLICAHPTPPVFDGDEDRNGCRNYDEIRMVADYISGNADYLIDDRGGRGGLERNQLCVVVGDMNADPFDGDSRSGAACQLTDHPGLNHSGTPSSQGAVIASQIGGGANNGQRGNAAFDTADFNDHVSGNFRVDYCLPCAELPIVDSGVFWPAPEQPGSELNDASDHHLVWVDVQLVGSSNSP